MAAVVPWLASLGTTTGAAAGTAAVAAPAIGVAAPGAIGVGGIASASALEALAAPAFASASSAISGATAAGGLGSALAGAGKLALGSGAASLLAPKPSIPTAPSPPTIDQARQRIEAQDRLRAKKGGAASILTSPLGISGTPTTATKTLLGG